MILVIDELKALFTDPHTESGDSAVANEVTTLLDVYARNYAIWPVLATQDPMSFGGKTQQTLLGIGTHIVGRMDNTDAAVMLSHSLIPHDVSMNYSLDDIAYTAAKVFQSLSPLHFRVRPAGERKLYQIRIEPDTWPSEHTTQLREQLAQKSGRPIKTALEEIAAQRFTPPPTLEIKPKRPAFKLNEKQRTYLPPPDTDEDVS